MNFSYLSRKDDQSINSTTDNKKDRDFTHFIIHKRNGKTGKQRSELLKKLNNYYKNFKLFS